MSLLSMSPPPTSPRPPPLLTLCSHLVVPPSLLAATCPLPENNANYQNHALPLLWELKVLDESWQSRQGVEATVLTAITEIGADSYGAWASLSLYPSLSLSLTYTLALCIWKCVYTCPNAPIINCGEWHFNKDYIENGAIFLLCLGDFFLFLTHTNGHIWTQTSYSLSVCVWFCLPHWTKAKTDRAKLTQRRKQFKVVRWNKDERGTVLLYYCVFYCDIQATESLKDQLNISTTLSKDHLEDYWDFACLKSLNTVI